MRRFFVRVLRMIIGLFLFALGVVLIIRASIGYAPWDVFHVGIAKTFGLTIGTATISVGFVLLILLTIIQSY